MLEQIEIIKKDNGVLTLPIYNPTTFFIKDIQGLDPVKANIVTSNFSQMDGVQYQSSRREMRNLIFKIGIDSANIVNTVQDLRKQLYSYLSPKSEITLRFKHSNTTMPYVLIKAMVESFDSPIFVKDPEATISLLCFDPDFYSENSSIFSGSSVSTSTDSIIAYEGDVETGFIFTFNINRTLSEFTIQNTMSDGFVRKMHFISSTFIAGDIIIVSTIPGNKYVRLNRSGVITSVLWTLDPASDWLKLYPGENLIRVSCTGAAIPYTMEYNLRYGGL